jgi:hypothetical protein
MQSDLQTPVHRALAGAVLALGCALAPAMVTAQTATAGSDPVAGPGLWRYTASIYGYLPSVGGSTPFPADGTGTPIYVSSSSLIDKLKFTFQGGFEAHNGVWGYGTDLVYLDLGGAKSNSRDFSIGNIGLPAGTTADLDWDFKGWVWTLAGTYRLVADPSWTLDALGGTRLFETRQRLIWSISGDLGPIEGSGRNGNTTVTQNLWDGIVGVKGRYVFGADRAWSLPFYLDAGAGQSSSTVQVAAGVSYAFKWGDLDAKWRYLGYRMKAGSPVYDLNFNGPMIGAAFHW